MRTMDDPRIWKVLNDGKIRGSGTLTHVLPPDFNFINAFAVFSMVKSYPCP